MSEQTIFAAPDTETRGKTFGEFVLTPYKVENGKRPVPCTSEEVVVFRLWANSSDMSFNLSGLNRSLRESMQEHLSRVPDKDASREAGFEVTRVVPTHIREDFTDIKKEKRGPAPIQTMEENLATRDTAERGMYACDQDGVGHPLTKDHIELLEYALQRHSADPYITRGGRPKGGGWVVWDHYLRGGAMEKIRKFEGRLVAWQFRKCDKDKTA